jgi:pilus assembly protein Flp/PilA
LPTKSRADALPSRPAPLSAAAGRREMVEMVRTSPMRALLALRSARDREEGQAMVEYALLLFLIAVVSIAVLTLLGHRVSSLFNEISNDL